MTSTNIKWGTMYSANAGASGIYAGASPYIFESGTIANHGMGVRMHARKYETSPNTAFASSGAQDVRDFNRGVRFLTSVSNQQKSISGFTWDKATNGVSAGVGSWDSQWTAFFARLAVSGGTSVGLKFSTAVDTSGANLLGSYGGITEPEIELCLDHEVDRPDKVGSSYGNATQFKAYFRHVHNLMVAAGIRSKFKLNWCITEFGLNTRVAVVNSTYPGDDVVDVVGVDFYGDFTGTWAYDGSTTLVGTSLATTFAWMRSQHPTKPFNFPEFSEAESGNDTAMATWYTGITTELNKTVNADLNCVGVYLWTQASSKYQNFNKISTDDPATATAHLGKHNGIIASIAASGANAPIGSVASVAPAAPTGLTLTSLGSDGTSAVVSWTTAPTMTPAISGERLYIGDGVTTSLHRQDAAQGQPDHAITTSYTFTGLTPGNTYTWSVTWANSVGNSGWATDTSGKLLSFTTTIPGVGGSAPSITTPGVITQDTSDVLEYDYVGGATDPHGLPLTYAWTFTSPTGNVLGPFSGVSGTTPELTESGAWQFSFSATNTVPLSVVQTGTFNVVLPTTGGVGTKYYNWSKPQTGDLVRTLGPLLRGVFDSIDLEMHRGAFRKSTHNYTQGLVASAFPTSAMHSSNTQTMTANWIYYAALVMEDDHFDEIWFLTKTTAQIGTGTQIAVYDSTGQILPNGVYSGTNVDAAFTGTVGARKYALLSDSIAAENNGGIMRPGDILYVIMKTATAGTTSPLLVVSGEPSTAGKLGDFATLQPDFGGWNYGSGVLPSTLPFTSWTAQQHVWMGLGASDVSPLT